METLEPILAEHPFIKGLAPQFVQLLVGCASNVKFDEGQFIIREGADADAFYIIRQGRVSLELNSPERGPITIYTLTEGEVLGWSWLFPPYHWHFDARALEMTRAIRLDGKCIREKCEVDHDLGYEILKRFAHIMERRLAATALQLLDLYGSRS
jgi:CRP-like cAMP-binding protein